jgi:hypothetical protein
MLHFPITPFSIRKILPASGVRPCVSGYQFGFSPTLTYKEDHDEQLQNVARAPRFLNVTLFSF